MIFSYLVPTLILIMVALFIGTLVVAYITDTD